MAVRVHRLGHRRRTDLSLDPLFLAVMTIKYHSGDEKTRKSAEVLKVYGDVMFSPVFFLLPAGRKNANIRRFVILLMSCLCSP